VHKDFQIKHSFSPQLTGFFLLNLEKLRVDREKVQRWVRNVQFLESFSEKEKIHTQLDGKMDV